MAKKPEITTIDLIDTAEEAINTNFSNVADAFDNTLSRDGSTPNTMLVDIDMNSNNLLNLPAPVLTGDVVTLGYFDANVASSTPAVENKLKVSSADTTVGFLSEKITTTNGLSVTIISPAADEDLEFGLVITADSGLEEIVSGLQVKDGEGISVDTVGVNLDFPSLTDHPGGSLLGADTFAVYSSADMDHREITLTDLAANLPTSPDATESVKGIVELATVAEAEAGTDTTRAITAAGLASTITASRQIMLLTEEYSSGTSGPSITANVWNKRVFNTIKVNNITGASLASSVITLPAGTYLVSWKSSQYRHNRIGNRLRNTSDNSTTGIGLSVYAGVTNIVANMTGGEAFFAIAATKNFEIQGFPETAGIVGIGNLSGSKTDKETYGQILIEKIG